MALDTPFRGTMDKIITANRVLDAHEMKALWYRSKIEVVDPYPSVRQMKKMITLEGTDLYPSFVYNARDAFDDSGTLKWDADSFGDQLIEVGSGSSPTLAQPSRYANDESVCFNSGTYFRNNGSTAGNIGTDDGYIEAVVKVPTSFSTRGVFSAHLSRGWAVWFTSTGGLRIRIKDDLGNSVDDENGVSSYSGEFIKFGLFIHYGATSQAYINGAKFGSAVDISSITGNISGNNVAMGIALGITSTGDDCISYASCYHSAGVLSTSDQDTFELSRYNQYRNIS